MKIKEIVLLAIIIMSAPYAHSIVLNGTSETDIYGSESYINAYDTSSVTTHIGSSISYLDGYDSSTFNIDGGDISWLELYDNNITNISFVEDLSWLLVSDDSLVNIYGTDFNYSGGHLSGTWVNGISFSFWALEELDLHSGNIGDILPDNIILHIASVPEPSSLVILLAGLTALIYRKNKT